MFKRSLIDSKIDKGMISIYEEEVSLGNTTNSSIIFRRHAFTIVRPNAFGSFATKKKVTGITANLKDRAQNLVKKSRTDEQYIDCSLLPEFILINPSNWGSITMKMLDGSEIVKGNNYDKLISLRDFMDYDSIKSLSYKFKLKVENV